MEDFIYSTPTKVYFGKDKENLVGEIVATYSPKKVLLHYGQGSVIRSGLLGRVKKSLEEHSIAYVELGGVAPNPTLEMVRQGIALCQSEGVDFVLAVGGGSVLDSAKDIANGVANPEDDVWDYTLGRKKPAKTLHKGAILTLSAAGSEMSDSAVITNSETHYKSGYNSPCNRFDFAIENPELTYSVSPYQTACGAVDIAMHTMERYFSKGGKSELTDSIAEAVVTTIIQMGRRCVENPFDEEARADMMWASSLAHNGLTGCGRLLTMPVHQLEHELSGLYPSVSHGAGLAALWPSWARKVYPYAKDRFIKFARHIWHIETADEEKAILEAIKAQEDYYLSIGMPISLPPLGVGKEDLPKLALACSRNKTRVIDGYLPLGYEEMLEIYEAAFGNGR